MAGNYDFNVQAGATFSFVITWQDSDGNPIDVTGYSAEMSVKDFVGTLVVSLTVANGRITVGGTNGRIVLNLDASTTEALPVGRHVYDLLLTSGTSVVRLLEGQVYIEPGVSP
jgi:hypothetical protein